MAKMLDVALRQIQEPSGHEQAYLHQKALTGALIRTRHMRRPALDLLDYGCGWRGVQRVIFESTKETRDRLALFDPFVQIRPSQTDDVYVAGEREIFGDNRTHFDIVGLSYVLCCVSAEEGQKILRTLHARQPWAQLLIVDYTLHNRSRMEVLALLTAQEEMKWRRRMGEDDFVATRRRFTRHSFEQFVRDAGYDILGHAAPLDRFGIRAAVVTRAQHMNGGV